MLFEKKLLENCESGRRPKGRQFFEKALPENKSVGKKLPERREKGGKSMKKKGKNAGRTFLISFTAALCILILVLGFLTVDYQGRRMSFGDDTPPIQVIGRENGDADLSLKFFGKEAQVDFTFFNNLWNFLCDFSCIPHN